MNKTEKVLVSFLIVASLVLGALAIQVHHRHTVAALGQAKLAQREAAAAEQAKLAHAKAAGAAEQQTADQATIAKLQAEVKPTATTKTTTR